MKKLLTIIFAAAALAACQPKENNETVAVAELAENIENEYEFYGEKISLDNAETVSALEGRGELGDTIQVKIEGTINATCAMKGCWMTLDGEEGDVRVTFKDYGFFVPTDGQEGKTAVIEGLAVKTVTDVATLKHYAQDAGKSAEEIAAITEPREEIALIATGVAIRQ